MQSTCSVRVHFAHVRRWDNTNALFPLALLLPPCRTNKQQPRIMLAHRPPSVLLFKVSCSLPINPTRHGVQAYVACDDPTSRHGAPQHMVTCWARTNMAKTVREMWCGYCTLLVLFGLHERVTRKTLRFAYALAVLTTTRCVALLFCAPWFAVFTRCDAVIACTFITHSLHTLDLHSFERKQHANSSSSSLFCMPIIMETCAKWEREGDDLAKSSPKNQAIFLHARALMLWVIIGSIDSNASMMSV